MAQRNEDLDRNKAKLLAYIRDGVIGSNDNTLLRTVFGEKPHVYCDYTASGKSLRFIEDYITNNIMPLYANTHSMQSLGGKQTSYVREESRAIIRRVCNANEDHAVVFTGTGSTAAVNLLLSKLKLKQICEKVKLASVVESFESESDKAKIMPEGIASSAGAQGDVSSEHFCKRNRWNSYDCTLCKVIVPSIGAYEKHAQSEYHLRAVEVEVS